MEDTDEVVSISEFVKSRLYFMTFKDVLDLPQGAPFLHYFCTDEIFKYENFYDDFGPLNLSMLYRYCHTLNLKMQHVRATRIIHATSSDPRKRVNAAYLIGCYSILYLDFTPEKVYETLMAYSTDNFVDFRDASSAEPHTISLLDCLSGLHKAKTMGFFNFDNFDCEHYEFYERVENGDLNWIVPRKFLAFCGPYNVCENIGNYPVHAVPFYYRYFRTNGVTTIVRLNKRAYSASLFTRAGFAHRDLYFMDGSTPTDEILYEFLQICEGTSGAIAVHCKAGLGRTGTLIACYIMKHYRFTAREAIAWIRICRPGSIIGPQQEWLLSKMTEMWHDGQVSRRRPWRAPLAHPTPPTHRTPIYALRAGQSFDGILSNFHRQHIRLHCRGIVPPPFYDTIATGVKGRYTPMPSSKGCTTADTYRAKARLKRRQQMRAQQLQQATANTQVIQRKVNTMRLDDQDDDLVETDEADQDADSEETDDDVSANNNNAKMKMVAKTSTDEDDDGGDVEHELAEKNSNITVVKKAAKTNENNNSVAANNKGTKPGHLTQGDKLNQIKAQRTRYTRNSLESASNSVSAAKGATDLKPSPGCQVTARISSDTSTSLRTVAKFTHTKRRGDEANMSSARNLSSQENSVRRTSARIAAKAAAAKAPSSYAIEDPKHKYIRPNVNIWISRIVPNKESNAATDNAQSGMEMERETRSKRALNSERRIVKVFRKANQIGAPIKTRKIDAATTFKN